MLKNILFGLWGCIWVLADECRSILNDMPAQVFFRKIGNAVLFSAVTLTCMLVVFALSVAAA